MNVGILIVILKTQQIRFGSINMLSLWTIMASPIDKIFEEIFGYKPEKDGTAYELLAAIATHMINGGEVKHDDKLRGDFSKTLYQLDVHHSSNGISSMGEAKDYTVRNSKVGRDDLQKLGGALPDLNDIDAGSFFSATGYTKPAIKYAEVAESITGKPIILYVLRPSTALDEKGFIKTIVINMHIATPQPDRAKWLPHITVQGQEALKTLLTKDEEPLEYEVGLHCFYDQDGKEILSLHELTSHGYGPVNSDTIKSHGCFLLKDHYMKINGVLAEIHGLEYEIPFTFETRELRITDDSEHRFVLLDKDENILKFLTDKELREYEFDESENLKKR